MNTWEMGMETSLLDAIIDGRKVIEGRLNRDKFALFKVSDRIWLRRDYHDKNGVSHDGERRAALVEIVAIRHYESFLELIKNEGFKKVIPSAKNAIEAADEYNKFYPKSDQEKYGVLAIEVRLVT